MGAGVLVCVGVGSIVGVGVSVGPLLLDELDDELLDELHGPYVPSVF